MDKSKEEGRGAVVTLGGHSLFTATVTKCSFPDKRRSILTPTQPIVPVKRQSPKIP
jgi:hypothetical protein